MWKKLVPGLEDDDSKAQNRWTGTCKRKLADFFMYIVFIVLFHFVVSRLHQCSSPECLYLQERHNLVKQDESISFDAHVVLNHQEKIVSNFLSSLVEKEVEKFDNTGRFITAKIFTEIKEVIEKTQLFHILSLMPKGAILHSHSIGDPRELIKMGTYRNDCWINTGVPLYYCFSTSLLLFPFSN